MISAKRDSFLLSTGQVAERLNMTHRQVRTMIHNGILPAIKGQKDYRIALPALLDWQSKMAQIASITPAMPSKDD